jgi:hypothetical protein
MPSFSARGSYRTRAGGQRRPRLQLWLTSAEWDTASAAAARAGMAPGAFAAQALLNVAEYRTVYLPGMRRQMIVAMMQAAAQVSRIGTTLDPAVAQLKATGAPGPDLDPAAHDWARVLRLLDEACELVRRRLR